MGTDGGVDRIRGKREFPPPWVAGALRALLSTLHFSLLVGLAYGARVAMVKLHSLHRTGELQLLWGRFLSQTVAVPVPHAFAAAAAALVLVLLALWWWRERIYLLDFQCYRPPDHLKVSHARFIQGSRDAGVFDDEAMAFQERILQKSALSEETFVPPALHLDPPIASMELARQEAEMVMFSAVHDLLARTGLTPRQVDIVVVNCSLFNPTPSLSAMIINHFKMRSDVESFNLGGMGCSAGILSIDLARKLLSRLGRGGYALVVSTENITQNWYRGNSRSMLIPNTIFRMGSAAVLLTNKALERPRARYELAHIVRVHLGADDEAYRCVYQHSDGSGNVGVELDRNLVRVAARSMEVNLRRLGPLVLPWSEKLMFAANWVARRVARVRCDPYVPDFKRAFTHFCLHAGGRGVVEGLSKQLGLPPPRMAPSANTLYWYGNTSSSTVWYSFGFVESVQGVRRGDVVWQIGFGSGFKCNSAVWRALKSGKVQHEAWAHITGREGEALDTLAKVAAATVRERQEKAATEATANGGLANGHSAAANGHVARGGRVLRNGKVLA